MIGKKPLITILRSANFTPRIEQYADYTRLSYEKMLLPKIDSKLKDMTKTIETDGKIYATINSLEGDRFQDTLSQKLNHICDIIDNGYLARSFQEETSKPSNASQSQTATTDIPPQDISKEDKPSTEGDKPES